MENPIEELCWWGLGILIYEICRKRIVITFIDLPIPELKVKLRFIDLHS